MRDRFTVRWIFFNASRTIAPFVKEPDSRQAPRRGAARVFLSRPYLAALVLLTRALVAFWRVQDHSFVWDDAINVEKNSAVISGFSQVSQFWQAPYQNLYILLSGILWTITASKTTAPNCGRADRRRVQRRRADCVMRCREKPGSLSDEYRTHAPRRRG